MGNGIGTVTDAYQRAQEARAAAINGTLPDLKKLAANGVSMDTCDKVGCWCPVACVAYACLQLTVVACSQRGFTPLYWAAWGGQQEVVAWLVEVARVNVLATDVVRATALSRLCWRLLCVACVCMSCVAVPSAFVCRLCILCPPTNLLIEGSRCHTLWGRWLLQHGNTALHRASDRGHVATARYLALQAGIPVDSTNKVCAWACYGCRNQHNNDPRCAPVGSITAP